MTGATREFWLYLPQMRMSFATIVERAQAAERAGFDGVALMDHMAPPALTSAPAYDAMTTAAAIAAGTERLGIGHLVLCCSFRHPSVLAKEVVSLDHLSDGRFELGLGWGSVPGELDRFGLGAEDSATRAARMQEYLIVLNALFSGEPVDHEGRFYALHGAQQNPRPLAGRVPVVIGGGGPKLTMPLVARFADWWNCPVYAASRLDELRPLAGTARVSSQHPVGLAAGPADEDRVTQTAQRRFGGWGGLITGTPDRVAGELAGLADRGVERFYLQFSDFGEPETLDRFGAEVIPAVRAAESRPQGPKVMLWFKGSMGNEVSGTVGQPGDRRGRERGARKGRGHGGGLPVHLLRDAGRRRHRPDHAGPAPVPQRAEPRPAGRAGRGVRPRRGR
jgi:alkanesulfonate monooxygenase SsuD/methylene tetrahydromethanopterin reductase-like flavin-dependent oxidoreductase (luciferase family)